MFLILVLREECSQSLLSEPEVGWLFQQLAEVVFLFSQVVPVCEVSLILAVREGCFRALASELGVGWLFQQLAEVVFLFSQVVPVCEVSLI